MKKTFCLAVFSFVICACMFGSTMIAYAASLPTRFSAEGYAIDYTVGAADWMWPVIGDRAHLLYVDPSVGYGSDDQGYADVGLGYRWINKKARLWGVYLFGGYSRIEQNAHLWVANPGIEAFGRRWDAHLNTYFVMGDRHYRIGTDQQIYFKEHSEFSRTFYLFQSSGHGADVKFGYQPFVNSSLKGYLGSYFFESKQSSPVWGGAAGLEYWLDPHFNIFARYTYDHLRHHTGAIGLGVELGSTRAHRDQTPCLEERLIDPVARYLAELGHGTAIPSKRYAGSLGSLQILNDHIAFFSRSGMPNNGGVGLDLTNCTFEKPCGPTDFTDQGVSTLNLLLPNTTMYFNGGLYSALNVKEGSSPVTLLSGQSVWGRTVDYSRPPVHATERSVFEGWFALTDKNTVSDIVVMLPVSGGGFSWNRDVTECKRYSDSQ